MAEKASEIDDEFGVFDHMPDISTTSYGNDIERYSREEGSLLITGKRRKMGRLAKDLFMLTYGKFKEVAELDALATEMGKAIKYYDDNYQLMIDIFPEGCDEPYTGGNTHTFHMDRAGKHPLLLGYAKFSDGMSELRDRIERDNKRAEINFVKSLKRI